jgi:hypothetical protein
MTSGWQAGNTSSELASECKQNGSCIKVPWLQALLLLIHRGLMVRGLFYVPKLFCQRVGHSMKKKKKTESFVNLFRLLVVVPKTTYRSSRHKFCKWKKDNIWFLLRAWIIRCLGYLMAINKTGLEVNIAQKAFRAFFAQVYMSLILFIKCMSPLNMNQTRNLKVNTCIEQVE